MIIYYKAKERKPLVKAISEFIGVKEIYMKTPTYAYKIGCFTVTKDGDLEFDECSEQAKELINHLAEKGFIAENSQILNEQKTESLSEIDLTIELPRDKANVENLEKIFEMKGELIKKALGIESLEFSYDDEKISFPWFKNFNKENLKIYTNFISALCKMSINKQRINKSSKSFENEKYAFRCFLLRLGFIGNEYKADRKLLLKNLEGSSAFKKEKNDELFE